MKEKTAGTSENDRRNERCLIHRSVFRSFGQILQPLQFTGDRVESTGENDHFRSTTKFSVSLRFDRSDRSFQRQIDFFQFSVDVHHLFAWYREKKKKMERSTLLPIAYWIHWAKFWIDCSARWSAVSFEWKENSSEKKLDSISPYIIDNFQRRAKFGEFLQIIFRSVDQRISFDGEDEQRFQAT